MLKPLEQKKELSDNISNIYDDKLPDFTEHLPKWGAKFSFGRSLVTVVNTCTIDNYLFALWFLSKIEIKLIENIPESSKSLILKQIIEKIDSLEWDSARQLWYTEIMGKRITGRKIDFFGTVQEYFLQYLYPFQLHDIIQKCNEACIKNEKEVLARESYIIYVATLKNFGFQLINGVKSKWELCKNRVTSEMRNLHLCLLKWKHA